MSRVICITGTFPVYRRGIDTGEKEFLVSHGIDEASGRTVILPCEHPARIGAVWDAQLGEWVLRDYGDSA